MDINRALIHSHTANLLQFVCGLGPRKAQFIIRTLKVNKRLENRSQLVHICQMGPKVFMNSAGKSSLPPNPYLYMAFHENGECGLCYLRACLLENAELIKENFLVSSRSTKLML